MQGRLLPQVHCPNWVPCVVMAIRAGTATRRKSCEILRTTASKAATVWRAGPAVDGQRRKIGHHGPASGLTVERQGDSHRPGRRARLQGWHERPVARQRDQGGDSATLCDMPDSEVRLFEEGKWFRMTLGSACEGESNTYSGTVDGKDDQRYCFPKGSTR